MAKRDRTEEQLDRLAALRRDPPPAPELAAALRKALGARSAQVVAKAASVAQEHGVDALVPELRAAFAVRLQDPVRRDPGCAAKSAIVRALTALEDRDGEVFLGAARHVQREPVWGGTVDTAAELRGLAAIGLLETHHPQTTFEIVRLLNDPEPQTRVLAARAMADSGDLAAEAVLRFKALVGDTERDVVLEALTGLLHCAPERSLDFVGELLQHDDQELAETAALALGDSRLEGAFLWLERAWRERCVDPEVVCMALSTLRREPALALLLEIVGEGDSGAREALRALLLHRDDEALMERVRSAVEESGSEGLAAALER